MTNELPVTGARFITFLLQNGLEWVEAAQQQGNQSRLMMLKAHARRTPET